MPRPYTERMKILVSFVWVLIWLAVAVHCLVLSQGKPDLHNPLGPQLPPTNGGDSFSFAVLGDCQSFRRPLKAFRKEISQHDLAFAVQLGDFVDYDEDLAYHHFLARLGAEPTIPMFLVRGNHEAADFTQRETDRYLEYIPMSTYSFMHGNCLFAVVDSSHGTITDKDINRTRARIREFRRKHPTGAIFLFSHYPPNLPDSGSADLSAASSNALLAICSDYAVSQLISGHVHDHRAMNYGSTSVIVDGCGGGSLRSPSEEVHYLRFTVEGLAVTLERVPLPCESGLAAGIDFFLYVTVLRFRWVFLALAVFFIARESRHLWKKRSRHRRSATAISLAAHRPETDVFGGSPPEGKA